MVQYSKNKNKNTHLALTVTHDWLHTASLTEPMADILDDMYRDKSQASPLDSFVPSAEWYYKRYVRPGKVSIHAQPISMALIQSMRWSCCCSCVSGRTAADRSKYDAGKAPPNTTQCARATTPHRCLNPPCPSSVANRFNYAEKMRASRAFSNLYSCAKAFDMYGVDSHDSMDTAAAAKTYSYSPPTTQL